MPRTPIHPARRLASLLALLAVSGPLAGSLTASHTALAQPAPTAPAPPAAEPETPTGREVIIREAAAVRATVSSPHALGFLNQAGSLPPAPPRTLHRHKATRKWLTEAEFSALSEADRVNIDTRAVDEQFYYAGRYGTPIAYARALEVLSKAGFTVPTATATEPWAGAKVMDFGYGVIGHLRMLASAGAQAIGVDVDPILPILYGSPQDEAASSGSPASTGRTTGSLALFTGRWPAEEKITSQVGAGYDLIISKNTLKNGYLHPAEKVDERMLVKLGVSDEEFIRTLHDSLKPGGWVIIYNICPAPAPPGKPYIPWADGRCPFPRPSLEAAGFTVLAFDVNDDDAVRAQARALGWDSAGMDIEHDLFAWYTILQRAPGK